MIHYFVAIYVPSHPELYWPWPQVTHPELGPDAMVLSGMTTRTGSFSRHAIPLMRKSKALGVSSRGVGNPFAHVDGITSVIANPPVAMRVADGLPLGDERLWLLTCVDTRTQHGIGLYDGVTCYVPLPYKTFGWASTPGFGSEPGAHTRHYTTRWHYWHPTNDEMAELRAEAQEWLATQV